MYKQKLVNIKKEELYDAGASQFNLAIKKGTQTHLLMLYFTGLQDGATKPVLADMLNQLASQITISIGNTTIIKFDPIQYHEYLIRKFNILGLAFSMEASGADNDAFHFALPIILAPIDKSALQFGRLPLLQEGYGFDGNKEVSVLIEYDAEGAAINTRKLSVYSISLPDNTPSKIVEWKEITTAALSVGSDQKIALSQKSYKKLYELIIQQTSYLEEGDNTDVRTLQLLGYMEDNELKHVFDVRLEDYCNAIYISESETTGDPQVGDQYQIASFSHGNDAETSLPMTSTSELSVDVGVAEAVTYTQRLIIPLTNVGN